jgi:hypothetical protein
MQVLSALAASSLSVVALTASAFAQAGPTYTWERADAQFGFAVYTSGAPNHSYDVIKVVAMLDVPLRILLGALEDFERYPNWYYDCSRVRVLTRPAMAAQVALRADGTIESVSSAAPYALLFVQRVPPLDNRWAIVRASMRQRGTGLVIDFQSLDTDARRGPSGAVRMRLHGAWTLAPLTRNRTQVTFLLDVDPNVSMPAFLVDPRLREIAVETVHGLQRITQR